MVADRVLAAILIDYCRKNNLPVARALQASTVSLQALIESGAQEASEEGGIGETLQPETVLLKIHHYKTGLLFQSTWAIPALFEPSLTAEAISARDALYRIGIGCQILDDIADLFIDSRGKRHNYVASVITHCEGSAVRDSLQFHLAQDDTPENFFAAWPDLAARVKNKAMAVLEEGLDSLFLAQHRDLVKPAAAFIADRIGVSVSLQA